MSTEEAVGCIGLGNMGMGMARNLVAARYDVLASDVAAAPLGPVVAQGARAATSPAEIWQVCRRAMVMVVHGDQVASVVSGDPLNWSARHWHTDLRAQAPVPAIPGVVCTNLMHSDLAPYVD